MFLVRVCGKSPSQAKCLRRAPERRRLGVSKRSQKNKVFFILGPSEGRGSVWGKGPLGPIFIHSAVDLEIMMIQLGV